MLWRVFERPGHHVVDGPSEQSHLCFSTDMITRELASFPSRWWTLDAQRLEALCAFATPSLEHVLPAARDVNEAPWPTDLQSAMSATSQDGTSTSSRCSLPTSSPAPSIITEPHLVTQVSRPSMTSSATSATLVSAMSTYTRVGNAHRCDARRIGIGVAEALINAMEAKDPYLRGHSHRVADWAASIAATLGLAADVVEDVRLAGQLHDVGMIGVPTALLSRAGPLTPAERGLLRKHVRLGVTILAPLPDIEPILTYVEDHHERLDGRGYPGGRHGDEISLGGRILAVTDAFDALTSNRPYREALSWHESLTVLDGAVGSMLDAEVYAALRTLVTDNKLLPFVDVVSPTDRERKFDRIRPGQR